MRGPREYRKKPVTVEAIQFVGAVSVREILAWAGETTVQVFLDTSTRMPERLEIITLEGTMTADVGDYIIKGVAGEFYPCKPEIFWATYEPVRDQPTTSPISSPPRTENQPWTATASPTAPTTLALAPDAGPAPATSSAAPATSPGTASTAPSARTDRPRYQQRREGEDA